MSHSADIVQVLLTILAMLIATRAACVPGSQPEQPRMLSPDAPTLNLSQPSLPSFTICKLRTARL
jgi:hypothetical protein